MEKVIEEMINKAEKVIIRDFSNYCVWRCSNGGQYSFSTHFVRLDEDRDKWAVYYGTSSEFDYCSVFGEFRRCEDCCYWDGEECTAEVETVKTEEVIKAVEEAMDNEYCEVEIDGRTVSFGEIGCYECRKGLH